MRFTHGPRLGPSPALQPRGLCGRLSQLPATLVSSHAGAPYAWHTPLVNGRPELQRTPLRFALQRPTGRRTGPRTCVARIKHRYHGVLENPDLMARAAQVPHRRSPPSRRASKICYARSPNARRATSWRAAATTERSAWHPRRSSGTVATKRRSRSRSERTSGSETARRRCAPAGHTPRRSRGNSTCRPQRSCANCSLCEALRGRKDRRAVAALGLRLIHRGVGLAQHLRSDPVRTHRAVLKRDADAGGDPDGRF